MQTANENGNSKNDDGGDGQGDKQDLVCHDGLLVLQTNFLCQLPLRHINQVIIIQAIDLLIGLI